MSSLQIGLIIAGIFLVAGVIVYNSLQERRLRRSIDGSLAVTAGESDERAARMAQRVEPTLSAPGSQPAGHAPADEREMMSRVGPETAPSSFEPPLDVISSGPQEHRHASAGDAAEQDPLAAVDATTVDDRDSARDRAPLAELRPRTAGLVAGRAIAGVAPSAEPDPEIECVIVLQPAQPVTAGALGAGLHARVGKRLRWFGRADSRGDWQRLASDTPGRFGDVIACMLLADRNGAASRAQIDAFARIVGEIAPTLPAALVPPDAVREASRAESLDRLCADLDVQIGLTVQKPGQETIAGTRLRGVAEAAGFRLAAGGRFEYLHEDTGTVLYTLQNLRSEPFSAESLRLAATPGVVFILDVAHLADPARAFDQMKLAARRLAATLGAELVDDNRRALDDAALAAIREQVQNAADALRAVHIEPGSARALALFSA